MSLEDELRDNGEGKVEIELKELQELNNKYLEDEDLGEEDHQDLSDKNILEMVTQREKITIDMKNVSEGFKKSWVYNLGKYLEGDSLELRIVDGESNIDIEYDLDVRTKGKVIESIRYIGNKFKMIEPIIKSETPVNATKEEDRGRVVSRAIGGIELREHDKLDVELDTTKEYGDEGLDFLVSELKRYNCKAVRVEIGELGLGGLYSPVLKLVKKDGEVLTNSDSLKVEKTLAGQCWMDENEFEVYGNGDYEIMMDDPVTDLLVYMKSENTK